MPRPNQLVRAGERAKPTVNGLGKFLGVFADLALNVTIPPTMANRFLTR